MTRIIALSFIALSALFTYAQPSFAQPRMTPELQAILDDFDLTQAEIMQLGANIGGRMGDMEQKFRDRFGEPPTLQNYREKIGMAIDEVGPSITGIIRGELQDFLTADQYQKLETRVLQAHTSMMRAVDEKENPNPETLMANMPVGMMQMAIGPPSFLEFTEDQKQRLFELQKRSLIDVTGGILELEKDYPGVNPSTSPEMMQVFIDKMRPILLRFKREYEKILTDKQKAKIEELMDDMPDYLWGMMPHNRGKERAWRPGANSWQPGDGAPEANILVLVTCLDPLPSLQIVLLALIMNTP
jgi:Spy/CpxP family protein refolding chaperone